MDLRKRIAVLAGAVGLTVVVCVSLLFLPAFSADDPSEAESTASTAKSLYRVGEWEGQLAVFLEGQTRPDQVYDVYISTLPEEEQERLAAGIRVADDAALQRLLEDYTS